MNSFVVFGAGRFGSAVAKTLFDFGHEVMSIDINEEKIEDISDFVTTAVICDVLDEKAASELGLSNFDAAIVAIGENLEASIMATILAKEAGIGKIVAKAKTLRMGDILMKLGADRVVYPERDSGNRLGYNLSKKNYLEHIQLSDKYTFLDIKAIEPWYGKDLESINLRSKYNINVLAINRGDEILISPVGDTIILNGDILFVLADVVSIEEFEASYAENNQ